MGVNLVAGYAILLKTSSGEAYMTRLQKLYLPILVIAIFGSFPFYAPLILQISGVSQNSSTILQAGEELYPITTLTIIMIALLGYLGWYIDHVSLKRQLEQTRYNEREQYSHTWHNNFWQGIATELIGAAITAFLFGTVLVLFQQIQTIENEKQNAILQMGSPDNVFAIESVRIARQKGWLQDGSFEGAYFVGANLQGANLFDAQLSQTNLNRANLQGADLTSSDLKNASLILVNLSDSSLPGADFSGADLRNSNLQRITVTTSDFQGGFGGVFGGVNLNYADLSEVDLSEADLSMRYVLNDVRLFDSNWRRDASDAIGAKLVDANFQGANLFAMNLTDADLEGANLFGANLTEAILNGAILTGAILPDGTIWSDDVDMSSFTDIRHHDYIDTLDRINKIRYEMELIPIISF